MLTDLIPNIPNLDPSAMDAARARQDQLTKPPGSLGRLEEISIHLAGIQGTAQPAIQDKVITTMAGDHGVTTEGVSAFPAEVTAQMVHNFLTGGAAINVLADHIHARVVIADLGVKADFPAHPQLVIHKIGRGTGNIAQGPAMTPDQARRALQAGFEIAQAEIERGMDVLVPGDMGIGNTTPSAAIACALTGEPPQQIVGRGTGVDDQGWSERSRP